MTSVAPKYKLSVANYHKMAETGILLPEDRVELINGEIYQMSPIKSLHAGSVKIINAFLSQYNEQYVISVQDPIIIDDFSEPEPDIALLKYRADFYTESNPTAAEVLWIIEVSDSTLRYDRTVKKELYAKANIAEYWIINLVDCCLEVYGALKDDIYQKKQVYHSGETVLLPHIQEKVEINRLLIFENKKG